jgi:hypothetical protein
VKKKLTNRQDVNGLKDKPVEANLMELLPNNFRQYDRSDTNLKK